IARSPVRMCAMPAGMRIHIQRSSSPASSTSTLCRPEAVSRLASTEPAVPAPTMTKSYSPLFAAIFRDLRLEIGDWSLLPGDAHDQPASSAGQLVVDRLGG